MGTDRDAESFRAAQYFWTAAGVRERFPRTLERAASRALPVGIVKLPLLDGAIIRQYLKRAIPTAPPIGPIGIRLNGFMVAAAGRGLLFLDGTASADEQRYSLAHEIAHFLLDYHLPRRRASELLGPTILAVLDGHRAPTPAERIAGVLGGIPVGRYQRVIDIAAARHHPYEDAADSLALELLAPGTAVRRLVQRTLAISSKDSKALYASCEQVIRERFGLPSFAAEGLAERFARFERQPRIREWLGLGPRLSNMAPGRGTRR